MSNAYVKGIADSVSAATGNTALTRQASQDGQDSGEKHAEGYSGRPFRLRVVRGRFQCRADRACDLIATYT